MKTQLTTLAVILMVFGLMVVSANAKTDSSKGLAWESQSSSLNCGGCKAESGEKKDGCCEKKKEECKDKEAQDGECTKDKAESKGECPNKNKDAAAAE